MPTAVRAFTVTVRFQQFCHIRMVVALPFFIFLSAGNVCLRAYERRLSIRILLS
jgi:hypothetical protein